MIEHEDCSLQDLAELTEEAATALRDLPKAPEGADSGFTLSPARFFSLRYSFHSSPATGLVDVGELRVGFDDAYLPCSYDIRYKYRSFNPVSRTGQNQGLRPWRLNSRKR